MKKISNKILFLLIIALLSSCSLKNDHIEYSYINGEKVDSRLVYSGYYLDKATMSNALLSDALERIVLIDEPDDIGDVELPDISKIEIDTPKLKDVSQAEVEAYIEEKRDRAMEYKTILTKRPARIGDKVVIDASAYDNGNKVQGLDLSGQEVIIGNKTYNENIENALIGHKAGEQFDVVITMPKEIEDVNLKGKNIKFQITINYIQEPITPELDDEFIRYNTRMGATNSQAYRNEVKSILEAKIKYNSDMDVKNKLLNLLLQQSKCTPSEIGLAWKFSRIVQEQKRLATIQGMSFIEMLSQNGDPMQAIASYKYQTMYAIAKDMILKEIAKLYNVTMGEEDKVRWYDQIALVNEYGSDVNYQFYHDSMGDIYVYDNAYQDKVLTELMKHIKINFISEQNE